MAVESTFNILNSYVGRFIRRHPLVFMGLIVAIFWLPLIFKFFDGTWLTPMVNIYIMQFEYACIPVGFTIIYLVFIPIYYFYIKPYDAKLDAQISKAYKDANDRHKKRVDSFFK